MRISCQKLTFCMSPQSTIRCDLVGKYIDGRAKKIYRWSATTSKNRSTFVIDSQFRFLCQESMESRIDIWNRHIPGMYPFHLERVHELDRREYTSRVDCSQWYCHKLADNPEVLNVNLSSTCTRGLQTYGVHPTQIQQNALPFQH